MNRWPTRPLGEVCELVNGAPFKPSDWDGSGLPIVRIQNLNDPTKPFNYTSRKLAEKFRVRPGDTLLSWSGTPGTSFGCFRWDGPKGWLNQHIFNVHLGDEVLPPFFIYQVNSKLDELIGKAHGGVGLQHITKGALSSVNIAVPPLEEQERLVKLLDDADELRKLRAQADQRSAALIPALFDEMFGNMGSMPNRWPTERLGRLVTIEATLVDPRLEAYQDLPHIGPDRIERDNGKLLASKSAKEDGLISVKFLFDERDVLYSKIRPYLRKAALPIGRGLCSADMYPIRPGPKLMREFLWAYLLTDHFTDRAVELSARANMPKLNRVQLESIESPFPPLSLQTEFAQRVAEIRELETEQASSRRGLDGLFQSMLHRAFNGEV